MSLELCCLRKQILTQILLQGVAGLTKRDIQLVIDGGYNTVESVAYTPRRILEQIKGISEQKATKILTEGLSMISG
jgi:DNA repair protein RAD51